MLVDGVLSGCMLLPVTTIELFHGGHEPVTHIRNTGTFGGIFCATRAVAESHGTVVTRFDVPEARVLSNYTLNYELTDIDAIRRVLARECARGADLDRAWEIIVEDPGCSGAEDEADLFRCDDDDAGSRGWEAQRIRGRVAAALGYLAIEMRDEHGTTYLLVGNP